MADIIDIKSQLKALPEDFTNSEVCKIVLDDLLKNVDKLKEIYVFYKTDEDDLINIIETDISFQDLSVMLQLIQHHINLKLQEEDSFEEEDI
jgi:hypothetical protein